MSIEDLDETQDETQDDALELLKALAQTASQKKGFDLVAFKMTEVASFTDYFLIISATNPRAAKAIAEEIKRVARQDLDTTVIGIEGLEACTWILVDMPGVVVHIFDQTKRGFYNLEGLWEDAPRVDLPVYEAEESALPDLFFPG